LGDRTEEKKKRGVDGEGKNRKNLNGKDPTNCEVVSYVIGTIQALLNLLKETRWCRRESRTSNLTGGYKIGDLPGAGNCQK